MAKLSLAPTWSALRGALAAHGFQALGAFHAQAGDGVPAVHGRPAATLVLAGNAGAAMWQAFEAAAVSGDHPLDAWSTKVLSEVATSFGAAVVFPFAGPPYYPFQAWAMRATGLRQSPIGPLIHPNYGLWHAFRGALLFGEPLDLPEMPKGAHPCDTCAGRPCLITCPVAALSDGAYDVPRCIDHIAAPAGGDCLQQGCAARRACPVGRDYLYDEAQARFHMAAFLKAQS